MEKRTSFLPSASKSLIASSTTSRILEAHCGRRNRNDVESKLHLTSRAGLVREREHNTTDQINSIERLHTGVDLRIQQLELRHRVRPIGVSGFVRLLFGPRLKYKIFSRLQVFPLSPKAKTRDQEMNSGRCTGTGTGRCCNSHQGLSCGFGDSRDWPKQQKIFEVEDKVKGKPGICLRGGASLKRS